MLDDMRLRNLSPLISADERAEQELTALALEGIQSGEPLEVTSDYWQAKHRRLDERAYLYRRRWQIQHLCQSWPVRTGAQGL